MISQEDLENNFSSTLDEEEIESEEIDDELESEEDEKR